MTRLENIAEKVITTAVATLAAGAVFVLGVNYHREQANPPDMVRTLDGEEWILHYGQDQVLHNAINSDGFCWYTPGNNASCDTSFRAEMGADTEHLLYELLEAQRKFTEKRQATKFTLE